MGSIYEHDNYKTYLKGIFDAPDLTRGARSKLAAWLHCQTAFISQVLNGEVHFSLEHAARVNEFLKHSDDEAHFFMLLVQRQRAGSDTLRKYFDGQLQKARKFQTTVPSRIGSPESLGIDGRAFYYAHWYHAAIHILLSVKGFQTPEAIAARLQLPLSLVRTTLERLCHFGLAELRNHHWHLGASRIHIEQDSVDFPRHHANWRLRSIRAVDMRSPENLHYSSVMSLSKRDAEKIRGMMLANIQASEDIMRPSQEEVLYCQAFDFFEV